MSDDFTKQNLNEQRELILRSITELKENDGEWYSVKQLEKMKINIEDKLKEMHVQTKKDKLLTFEQMGIDRLFVDESHGYKNLFAYTKMQNVAGLSISNAKKSADMLMKTQYLNKKTGEKGVIFATGTPLSNSMSVLYTIMRYLSPSLLAKQGVEHFDAWAASYGETVTAMELKPEGTGYRSKTRFAKFYNIPELMAIFREFADIRTPDMLNLPVPKTEYITIKAEATVFQKEIVNGLAKRAERIRSGSVDSKTDNMLCITNDGRKLALDQRCLNSTLPDDSGSKVNLLVKNVYDIWKKSTVDRGTQLIFSDLSTPKGGLTIPMKQNQDGKFSVDWGKYSFDNIYHDIKVKLVEMGIPENEIAYIHDAKTSVAKTKLYAKMRSGKIRVLIGSTEKCGVGMNVQDRLVALHHVDVPWRPSDILQREGRIIRRGNLNPVVKIYKYVTKGTFDAYSWGLIENKQRFISQIMTSKAPVRIAEDIDESVLNFAEIKAIAMGNPLLKEKADLDVQIARLKIAKSGYESNIYMLQDFLRTDYPKKSGELKCKIEKYSGAVEYIDKHKLVDENHTGFIIQDKTFVKNKKAGEKLLALCQTCSPDGERLHVGEYMGLDLELSFNPSYIGPQYVAELMHNETGVSITTELSSDPAGCIQRIKNILPEFASQLNSLKDDLVTLYSTKKSAEE